MNSFEYSMLLVQAGHTTQDMKPGLALAEELFHKMLHLRILSESS